MGDIPHFLLRFGKFLLYISIKLNNMYDIDKLYRSYALYNNILLQLEGESDLDEYSIRPSADQKEIRKFRSPNAWNLKYTETENPRRFPCYSKMEIVRNFVQHWFDSVRFEEGFVKRNGKLHKNWYIKTRAFLTGKYKKCIKFEDVFLTMASDIVVRLDTLDPPDQQTATPQIRKGGGNKLGFRL